MTDPVRADPADDFTGDWRLLGDGASACFRTGSFASSLRFVEAIAAIPGIEDHHPDLDIRRGAVTVRLVTVTADSFGVSSRDVELAGAISAIARDHGHPADPSALQALVVIPGASDITRVTPFWRALLAYEARPDSPDEDLVDPRDRGPGFWFEKMEELRGDGGGTIHVAVWVPHDQAAARLRAVLAAGGRIVRDGAPRWWTLADPAGNEADITTMPPGDGSSAQPSGDTGDPVSPG